MRKRVPLVLGILATVAELAGAYHLAEHDSAGGSPWASRCTSWRCSSATRRPARDGDDLSRVESDLVLAAALLVPLFGPCLAWALPAAVREEDSEENAHEAFVKYSEHVKPALPDYERTLFTGDYEKDVARELDAESYHEVLRHGETDQKRNALRRLAEMGEAKHFRLIRQCLFDPEHEVRLYAYSELERSSRIYEEGIAKRAKHLKKNPTDPEALVEMAQTYFEYAASGIHDEQMGAFYFRSAERYATDARRQGMTAPEPVWLRSRALSRLGDFAGAREALQSLTPGAGEPSRELRHARGAGVPAARLSRGADGGSAPARGRRGTAAPGWRRWRWSDDGRHLLGSRGHVPVRVGRGVVVGAPPHVAAAAHDFHGAAHQPEARLLPEGCGLSRCPKTSSGVQGGLPPRLRREREGAVRRICARKVLRFRGARDATCSRGPVGLFRDRFLRGAAAGRQRGASARSTCCRRDESWKVLVRRATRAEAQDESFLNFFWTWRYAYLPLFNLLSTKIPRARVYHTISTGYAGMLAAGAKIKDGRTHAVDRARHLHQGAPHRDQPQRLDPGLGQRRTRRGAHARRTSVATGSASSR